MCDMHDLEVKKVWESGGLGSGPCPGRCIPPCKRYGQPCKESSECCATLDHCTNGLCSDKPACPVCQQPPPPPTCLPMGADCNGNMPCCMTGKVPLRCLGGSNMIPHPLTMGGFGLSGCCEPINNQWSTITTIVQQPLVQPQFQYQVKHCCQSCICQPYQKVPSKFPSVGPKNYGYSRYGQVPSYNAKQILPSYPPMTVQQKPSYPTMTVQQKPSYPTMTVQQKRSYPLMAVQQQVYTQQPTFTNYQPRGKLNLKTQL